MRRSLALGAQLLLASVTSLGAAALLLLAPAEAAGGPTVTRVHLTGAPSGQDLDLAWDAVTGTHRALLRVTAGAHAFTATAYAGATAVGSGSAALTAVQGATSIARVVVLDATPRPPAPDHGPVVASASASSTSPVAGAPVSLALTAADPDGDPLAYAWSSSCGGSFSAPSAATTTWSAASPGACVLTGTATSRGLADRASIPVTVQAAGCTVVSCGASLEACRACLVGTDDEVGTWSPGSCCGADSYGTFCVSGETTCL